MQDGSAVVRAKPAGANLNDCPQGAARIRVYARPFMAQFGKIRPSFAHPQDFHRNKSIGGLPESIVPDILNESLLARVNGVARNGS